MAGQAAPYSFDETIDRTQVPALKIHANVLGAGGGDLFAAGVADMDFRVAPYIAEALQNRLDHGVFGYEALPDGLLPALTNWLGDRHGWQVDESQILRAPNILNALAIAISLFTDESDGVIVQPPVFFDFFDILRENNRKMIANPLKLENGRYVMDFADLERKAADPRTKMILLCNPHNPVGRVWTKDELLRLGDICAANNVLVVADEIHGDIVFSGHTYTPFAALGQGYSDNCITCLSPAKSFNIAACCSAFTIISDETRRKTFQAENSRLTANKNNAFANVAMEAAYKDGGPWLDDALKYLEKNLDLVRSRLQDISGVDLIEPEGTFLLWLDFRGLGLPSDELALFLRDKAKWAVTRGPVFGDNGAGFARLNIACPRARLEAALEQLASAVL